MAQLPQANIPASESTRKNTYCNPMDINYQYNWEQTNEKISYRSGADPVVINHNGVYYLFHTIQGGYWRSEDLSDWRYIKPSRWPMEDMCAPAAWSKGDTLFLFQSTFESRPIFYTTTPETGQLEFYNRWLPRWPLDIGPWDPALFYDEDLKEWYMYWGSSNVYPLFGAQLDKDRKLTYKTSYKYMFKLHPEEHGWERFGQDHTSDIKPFMEGAWMTKHKGKYYLQYGAPGTEFNVYANGTYVSDKPLGPWEYAPYNPVAYKPGGYMQGMGHGCTFKDNFGNYWNMGTPWIAVNWNFERRIDMVPAGFTPEGEMFSISRFADFPHKLPTNKWTKPEELFTGWMLLSYKKPVIVSSVKDKMNGENLTDENPRKFWVAGTNKEGENAVIDLLESKMVHALQINYTDYKSDVYDSAEPRVYIQFRIFASEDGKSWTKIHDNTNEKRDRPNAFIELEKEVKTRYIKVENVHVPVPNLAISDIRIFGKGNQGTPETPGKFAATRDTDSRNANIKWQKVPNVTGYNIRWGIAPDKLFQTYQIWHDEPAEKQIRSLNKGVKYYFAIESFNENGVSNLSEIVEVD